LWIAREILSSRYHRDGTKVPTWSKYCEEIGSSKQVINHYNEAMRMLAKYVKGFKHEPIRLNGLG